MTVVIHELHKAPIASAEILVKTGSASEGEFSGSGISHLVEHMLFKDESEKGGKSKKEKIKLSGAEINGFTSRDYTGYTVTISSEYILEALDILKDITLLPSFDALELKKEKEVILDEIRKNRDDPARLASNISWELAFKRHPYKYPVIGHEDLFRRLGKKELEEYYSKRYSPHNMVLVVSGDVNKETLFKEIKDMFGPIERKFVPSLSNISEPPQLRQRSRVEYRPVSLAQVAMSYKSPSIDSIGFYPLDILAIALGDGEESILTKELRNKKKLVYSVGCYNCTLRDSGLFYIYFTAEASNVDGAVTAILEQLQKIKNDGISEAELIKCKNIARAEFLNALEIAENRAGDIATSEILTNDYSFSQFYLDKLLDVKASDIKSAADTYLKKGSLNTVFVLPEEKNDAAAILNTEKPFNREVIRKIMPNGVKVIVSEDHSMPMCAISVLFLGGVRSEIDANNGISHLTSKLLLDGTSERDEEKIKYAIESEGGTIENISGNNTFGVTLNLPSDKWKTGAEVITDIVKNSIFQEEKIEKEKSLMLAAIKQRDDDIVKTGILLFKQNFFKGHPYRFDIFGTKESVQNIKRDDIARYYESLCVPANTVLAFTGDVNADEVIPAIEKEFSMFEGPKPKLPKPPAFKIPKTKKEVSESMKKEQSLIIIGFPAASLTDNDRYIFEAINAVMSGINGRMFNNVRDKLGMAYAIGSYFMPGIEEGYYIFYALTSAPNIAPVKKAILKEIKELKKEVVPEKELEAAKKYLITRDAAGLQRDSAFALKVSLDELYGLGYKNYEIYDSKINSVTAGQIKRVANQYFKNENSVIVTIEGETYGEKIH